MALFLDEQCVSGLVTMQDALEAVEEVFREQGRGNVVNVPRVRALLKGGILRITSLSLSTNAQTLRNGPRLLSNSFPATGEFTRLRLAAGRLPAGQRRGRITS